MAEKSEIIEGGGDELKEEEEMNVDQGNVITKSISNSATPPVSAPAPALPPSSTTRSITPASGNNSKDETSNNNNDPNNNMETNSNMSINSDDQGVEDWSCKMCTFKNPPEKFKCEMCFFERDRTTRKPRGNMARIAAQVVKQQEQIRQQTKQTRVNKQPKSRQPSTSESYQHQQDLDLDNQQPTPQEKLLKHQKKKLKVKHKRQHQDHEAGTNDNSNSNSNISISSPEILDGTIIKYSAPIASGTTGLIIDKKRFTQHSVTVNDVTITFTEFATRQNNYIRKKKKKRS